MEQLVLVPNHLQALLTITISSKRTAVKF